MTVDTRPGLAPTENRVNLSPPKVYRPEDLLLAPFPMRVEIKDKAFVSDVCLPIELNGHTHFLPIVPILDKAGKEIGKYFCWLDPHPDRRKDLANDGAVELARLLMGLPPEKTMVHSPPTGKSEYMTRNAVSLASEYRKFSEIIFKAALFQTSTKAVDGSKLAIAERYFPVTSTEIGKVMGLSRVQAAVIQRAPLNSHVKLDDIVSIGATTAKMGEIIQKVVLRKGKQIKLDDIPTIALGVEVEDEQLLLGYAPRPNIYARIVIPEITRPVIKIASGTELDLRELARRAP